MKGDHITNPERGNSTSPQPAAPVTDSDDVGFNYLPWLIGTVWPSTSTLGPHGDPKIVEVDGLVPQHALAALFKLTRWARHSPTGELLELDVDAREVAVRTSTLGLTLAARALGMRGVDELYALLHDTTEIPVGADIPTIAVLEVIYDVLTELNPMANGADLASPAASIASALLRRWTFTAKI